MQLYLLSSGITGTIKRPGTALISSAWTDCLYLQIYLLRFTVTRSKHCTDVAYLSHRVAMPQTTENTRDCFGTRCTFFKTIFNKALDSKAQGFYSFICNNLQKSRSWCQHMPGRQRQVTTAVTEAATAADVPWGSATCRNWSKKMKWSHSVCIPCTCSDPHDLYAPFSWRSVTFHFNACQGKLYCQVQFGISKGKTSEMYG